MASLDINPGGRFTCATGTAHRSNGNGTNPHDKNARSCHILENAHGPGMIVSRVLSPLDFMVKMMIRTVNNEVPSCVRRAPGAHLDVSPICASSDRN